MTHVPRLVLSRERDSFAVEPPIWFRLPQCCTRSLSLKLDRASMSGFRRFCQATYNVRGRERGRNGTVPYAVALRVESALSAVIGSDDIHLRLPLPTRCASILYLRAFWLTSFRVWRLLVASRNVSRHIIATCCRKQKSSS